MVSHCQAGVGTDFGLGAGCSLGCSLSCSLGFCCCCSCWRFSGFSSRVVSLCCKASSPPPSLLPVFWLSFSLASGPCATPFVIFAIMCKMPAPHSLSSSWQASHFWSLPYIHVIIPCHCSSSRADRVSNRFARRPTGQCSCVSACACCRIVPSMRLLQSLGAARSSLLFLCYMVQLD
jgi:hypothetical protein